MSAASIGQRQALRHDRVDLATTKQLEQPNHLLHALLSLLLCGLWLIVWLLVVLETQEVRRTLTVDAYGVVHGLPEHTDRSGRTVCVRC